MPPFNASSSLLLQVRISGISSLWHLTQAVALEGVGVTKLDGWDNLLNQCTVQIMQQQRCCPSASLQTLWGARVERTDENCQIVKKMCVMELAGFSPALGVDPYHSVEP